MRQDVIGTTLAELTLLLLFLVIAAFFFVNDSKSTPIPIKTNVQKDEVQKLKTRLRQMEFEKVELKNQLNDLKLLTESLQNQLNRPGLTSNQTPTCHELKLAPTWIAEIGIIGVNRFKVNDNIYNYTELVKHFKDDLKFAEQQGCNHCVKFWFNKNISTVVYHDSLTKLQKLFIVTPIGNRKNE